MKQDQKESLRNNARHFLQDFIYSANGMMQFVSSNMVDYINKTECNHAKLRPLSDKMKEEMGKENGMDNCRLNVLKTELVKINAKQIECYNMLDTIPGSVVVSLVSSFTYFVSQLYKHILIDVDGAIECQNISVQYNEIKFCSSLDEVKKYYIEKYLDGVFRDSIDASLEEVEKKLKIKGLRKIDGYKDLLLISCIRNIIVHNSGKISITFKNDIKKYGITQKQCNRFFKKEKLVINPKDLMFIINTLSSCALQIYLLILDHFLRKENDLKESYYGDVNNICIEYLPSFQTSVSISVYNAILKNKLDSANKFFYSLNLALCYKVIGQEEKMNEIINSLDWSNCNEEYKFARLLLLDDFESAAKMISNGNEKDWEYRFQCWYLCKEFIKSEAFLTEYKATRGRNFEIFYQTDSTIESISEDENHEADSAASTNSAEMTEKVAV